MKTSPRPAWPVGLFLGLFLPVAAGGAAVRPVTVPNGSFEDGNAVPAGWTLHGGGQYLKDGGADGRRAVAATGDGKGSSAWQSPAVALAPASVYELRFRVRATDAAAGGTATSGPGFCNRDLGIPPAAWTAYRSRFRTGAAPTTPTAAADSAIRLGQWEVKGAIAFDDVRLYPALPVHFRAGRIPLGAGETLRPQAGGEGGCTYEALAPLGEEHGNFTRTLGDQACHFNSNRWCFADGSRVEYYYDVGRSQRRAAVELAVCWYQAGELAVEASANGQQWTPLGTLASVTGRKIDIPAALLPARAIWLRLSARPIAGGKKGCSLQVNRIAYTAAVDGEPVSLVGHTNYFVATQAEDTTGVQIHIADLGEALPGGRNTLVAGLVPGAGSGGDVAAKVSLAVTGPDGKPSAVAERAAASTTQAGATVRIPYDLAGAGDHTLRLTVATAGGKSVFEAGLHVAALHDASYGMSLPGGGDAAALWWCSTGWKVSRTRPAPKTAGDAIVLRAARNQAQAAQLVIRPVRDLKALRVEATALAGPGGASIPAAAVEVLRVRYVPVSQPTDATGVAGDWPDPLPPLAGPIDMPAGRNQPLWVRVKVPPAAPAGTYRGTVRLSAEGFQAEAPIRLEVYAFALPDRMTCVTAFGFDPAMAWQYQNVRDPAQKREVLDKYLACLAAHHISPYDPAPMDPIVVTWPAAAAGAAKPLPPEKLVPKFDFTAWDAAMRRAMDRYHFNSFAANVQGMGGGSFESRTEPSLLGYAQDTPEYQAAFANYCRLLQEHLREKGWLKDAFVYWFDEPDPKDYAFVMNGFRKLKASAPGLGRMLTEQVEPALVGGPNIWCPVTPEYNHARAEQRRAAGERFWWYVCCAPKAPYCTLFIDHPATELRVWLWQTWQRRIDGILVWQTNYWTSSNAYPDRDRPQNPYEDPMGWVSGYGTPPGGRVPWGNGDGRFLYPPESAADGRPKAPVLAGPVESIRLEMLREGIEDYEYLTILRRLLTERGGKLPAEKRTALTALLDVPPDITKDMTTFTKDPAPIESRRHAVAGAIEELWK